MLRESLGTISGGLAGLRLGVDELGTWAADESIGHIVVGGKSFQGD
jgi:hypothetical protein